jgi:coenzyme F420-reducing hydrogenase alpha subunit
MRGRTIKVDMLARVEGEGALTVKVRQGGVDDVQLRIFEPPRLFEAFLRGRDFREAGDITARICGICHSAYQMSASHAMEDLCGVKPDPRVRNLRRLISCGEWIESHTLHVYLLHAPDFLGYEDAIRMAQDYGPVVAKALKLKKAGNLIMSTLLGREVHPVNMRVGGFWRAPSREEVASLEVPLEEALEIARETVQFTGGLTFPDFEQNYQFVALRSEDEYAINHGRLVSNKGLDIAVSEYEQYFVEEQVPHSTALHSVVKGSGAYLVGPLARFNLNFDKLSPTAQAAAREAGMSVPCLNPFKSIVARAVETLYACEEALRLIRTYEPPQPAAVEVSPVAGVATGCTEAPRGILYHRYTVDERGVILNAKIVPPTSQNQKRIEMDLRALVPAYLDEPEEHLTWRCEQAIRNYDPCISCSTHFLRLNLERL